MIQAYFIKGVYMKRYLTESIVSIIQILIFYILPLPLFTGSDGNIGMPLLMLFPVFILSFVLGFVSKEKKKFLYPLLTAIVFIPTVFIYYNESALIYSVVYLIISVIGVGTGSVRYIFTKTRKASTEREVSQ